MRKLPKESLLTQVTTCQKLLEVSLRGQVTEDQAIKRTSDQAERYLMFYS